MIRLLVAALFIATTLNATAQLRLLQRDSLDWPTPRNAIVVNPGGIAVDYVSLTYLMRIADHHALGVFTNFIYRPVGAYIPRAIGGGLLYRYYPGRQALWRFHYSGQVSYIDAWLTGTRETATAGVGIGGTVGWQWFPLEGFAVGFSIGEQYIFPLKQTENEALKQIFGFRPLLSFDVGFAWR